MAELSNCTMTRLVEVASTAWSSADSLVAPNAVKDENSVPRIAILQLMNTMLRSGVLKAGGIPKNVPVLSETYEGEAGASAIVSQSAADRLSQTLNL